MKVYGSFVLFIYLLIPAFKIYNVVKGNSLVVKCLSTRVGYLDPIVLEVKFRAKKKRLNKFSISDPLIPIVEIRKKGELTWETLGRSIAPIDGAGGLVEIQIDNNKTLEFRDSSQLIQGLILTTPSKWENVELAEKNKVDYWSYGRNGTYELRIGIRKGAKFNKMGYSNIETFMVEEYSGEDKECADFLSKMDDPKLIYYPFLMDFNNSEYLQKNISTIFEKYPSSRFFPWALFYLVETSIISPKLEFRKSYLPHLRALSKSSNQIIRTKANYYLKFYVKKIKVNN